MKPLFDESKLDLSGSNTTNHRSSQLRDIKDPASRSARKLEFQLKLKVMKKGLKSTSAAPFWIIKVCYFRCFGLIVF